MKIKLLISLALVALACSVKAQKKQKKIDTALTLYEMYNRMPPVSSTNQFNISKGYITGLSSFQQNYSIVFQGGGPDPIISMELKKDGQPAPMYDWDTMVIHFKKSQFRWLNDSTAVYFNIQKQ